MGLVLAVAIFLSAAIERPAVAPGRAVYIVVNRSNAISSLTRAQASAIFMKKVRRWPDRSDALPVDQSATSAVRERFSQSIHGKSVAFVTRYWQRLIFSGRGIPPPEFGSDAEVIEFVRKNRGAIGYIGDRAALTNDVKLIEVTE